MRKVERIEKYSRGESMKRSLRRTSGTVLVFFGPISATFLYDEHQVANYKFKYNCWILSNISNVSIPFLLWHFAKLNSINGLCRLGCSDQGAQQSGGATCEYRPLFLTIHFEIVFLSFYCFRSFCPVFVVIETLTTSVLSYILWVEGCGGLLSPVAYRSSGMPRSPRYVLIWFSDFYCTCTVKHWKC